MYAGDGARLDVIGQVTQHDTVTQRRRQVIGQLDLQAILDDLEIQEDGSFISLLLTLINVHNLRPECE